MDTGLQTMSREGVNAMRFVGTLDTKGSVKEWPEHLSDAVLWTIVKSEQCLPDAYVQHVKECRDCRQFVWEFSIEARREGFRFPDLLAQTYQQRSVSPMGIGRPKST